MTADYSLYSRIANAERWAATTEDDRRQATAPAREAWARRFTNLALAQNPDLTGPDLIKAAERLKAAHMLRMSKAAADARARKRKGRAA